MTIHHQWRQDHGEYGEPLLVYSTGQGRQAVQIKTMLRYTVQRVLADGIVTHLQSFDDMTAAKDYADRFIDVWVKGGQLPAV